MFRRAAGAGLLLALGCVPCAAGVVAVATPPSPAVARDLALTIQARGLLLRDRELAALNVGVRVRNRVAVLWGPVPSAEMAFKAEVYLRGLVELIEVRNELHVTGEPLPVLGGLPSPPAFHLPELPPTLPALPPGVIPPPPLPAIAAPVQPPALPTPDEVELPP